MQKTAQNGLLDIQGLTVSYSTPRGKLKAVVDVDLSVKKGEILGIVGESGSGKSTLALAVLRSLPPTGNVEAGTIRLEDLDVLSLRGEALRRYRWEKAAMVFQSAMNALDPVKTIESQIVETMQHHKRIGTQQAKDRVRSLLSMVNIDPSRAKSFPHELSGGMRQRAIIAMALCLDSALLLADEPTTALDVVVQAAVLRTIKDLQRRLGLTVIIISHDVSIMSSITDRIAIMYAGKLVEVGPTKEVIASPQHPYTEALLNAVPEIGIAKTMKSIPSSPPSLYSPPTGCRFHPRCPYAFDKCRAEEPKLLRVNQQEVACWLRS